MLGCVCVCVFSMLASALTHQSTVYFHLWIHKPPGKTATTGCVFLMQNISCRLPEGGNRLCVNTKPNYLPIVHLQDGESRVLCQLLFLFFRRVRVLKENKKDRCVHIYFGQIVHISRVRCNARGQGFNNKHICSVKKKYVYTRQYLGYFVNSLSVQRSL